MLKGKEVSKQEETLPELLPMKQLSTSSGPMRKHSSELHQPHQTRKASYVVEEVDTTHYNK